MAVSIGAARLLLLYALAKKNLVHFIFMAVSIRAARLLLLYALAKKTSVFYFHGCFYKDSKTAIAICFSK